ncbi:alpha/beta hydrolase [Brochothrix thermosphacta]|uniref:Carboxylesterase n=1 Tax=Brochothrix thermosphacta TaxID=2756 RepID=A0A2X0RUV1_BROTH|nr:carboxylesterase [Brochothrix thermosphacta]ANZ94795.1 carboxylesterase [Brochothrix thermosphacta]ANZ96898.1 carboxylesterase [Brochothrix thermosphacta]MDO7864321.1 carboxylesterase [Brochothrix thermosphacta]ODJ52810.1 carboxylesterase [Brochothrix thermosphacta]ODJ58348.1 carboxylesterase [Brochothrix thermosphacta]
MKLRQAEPFYFKKGPKAFLLLHGFTGNTADVRMLGRFLEDQNITSYAPLYKGHGGTPEALLETTPEDWWSSVLEGYQFLKDEGFDEIVVAGLSLGGAFSLKLGYNLPVKGIITMAAPSEVNGDSPIIRGFRSFAEKYKQYEGKDAETIAAEMTVFDSESFSTITQLSNEIQSIRDNIDMIYAPIMVAQGEQDKMVTSDNAQYIYDHVESNDKNLKWYPKSGHILTLDIERKQLHEDILAFSETLDWSN